MTEIKIHYSDDLTTAFPCGQTDPERVTSNQDEVTCHWCKKWLAEGWRR